MKKVFLAFFLSLVLVGYSQVSHLDLIIAPETLAGKIEESAQQLNEDYRDKELTIVMVMKGAICVTADLIRHLDMPFKLDYLRASSYGNRGTQGGELTLEGLDKLDI